MFHFENEKANIMNTERIRWQQTCSNFSKALNKLTEAESYIQTKSKENNTKPEYDDLHNVLNEIVRDGVIHRYS